MKGIEKRKECYKENVCLHTVENLVRFLYNFLVDLVSSVRVSQRRLTDVFFKKKYILSNVLQKIASFGKERQGTRHVQRLTLMII